MICYCSLAETKVCEMCSNNPDAKYPNGIKLHPYLDKNTTIFTDEGKHTCSYKVSSDAKEKSNKPSVQYWCSECDAMLDKFDKYCHNCGSKIDWSDFED